MNFLQAKQSLCSKLNISYDDVLAGNNSLFSIQDLDDALNFGVRKAWDYKTWPFTEGNIELNATYSVPTLPTDGFLQDIGSDFVEQSYFLAVVNGVPWLGQGSGKRNFADYMKWFSDYPTDTSKIWTEYGGFFYFNTNVFGPGYDIQIYGKLHAFVYTTDASDGDKMPFSLESDGGDPSDSDSSGNEAIILFAYTYLLSSEKKKNPTQAAAEEKRAYGILDIVWLPVAEGRAQNIPQNRPFFNTGDFFPNRRSGRSNNIGNF